MVLRAGFVRGTLTLLAATGLLGCHRPDPEDEPAASNLDAINRFIAEHGRYVDRNGVVSELKTIKLDRVGMAFSDTIYSQKTKNNPSVSEYSFRWKNVTGSSILVDKSVTALHLVSQPPATMRYYDDVARYWRKGGSPIVEFAFGREDEAVHFERLLASAELTAGAHLHADDPIVKDRRSEKLKKLTPEQWAAYQHFIKSGELDRVMARDPSNTFP
jgi:hypothetical protein